MAATLKLRFEIFLSFTSKPTIAITSLTKLSIWSVQPALFEKGVDLRGFLGRPAQEDALKLPVSLEGNLVKMIHLLLPHKEGPELGTMRTGKAGIPVEHLAGNLAGAGTVPPAWCRPGWEPWPWCWYPRAQHCCQHGTQSCWSCPWWREQGTWRPPIRNLGVQNFLSFNRTNRGRLGTEGVGPPELFLHLLRRLWDTLPRFGKDS